MKTHRLLPAALAALACAGLAGCGAMPGSAPAARAELKPTTGNTASGVVDFSQAGGGVAVVAKVSGLKPGQEHGFHVHEKGDCSSGDGMSAGGHFNPDGHPHGPQDAAHHAGDMPSLKADANGNAEARFTLTGVTIGSGATDLVGRGVIVHVQPDDYKTQPTGNAGARIACGVILKR
ncbi:superoxide dismutase family protein [Caldimonas sp. KR1-144]|uniref:superoxide dismutase family protein n=1 Tax=Caldimonas sp. KR1-144 TaxID=3400911 RepID=UPI003C120697